MTLWLKPFRYNYIHVSFSYNQDSCISKHKVLGCYCLSVALHWAGNTVIILKVNLKVHIFYNTAKNYLTACDVYASTWY